MCVGLNEECHSAAVTFLIQSGYICGMLLSRCLLCGLAFGMAVLVVSCASPKPITGGDKDETPPAIIAEESTPNHQTRFHDPKITLTFDEWFTLKDVFNQVVISPLMPHEPEIKQKGKSIIITLPDSLREETTYTINFGNAIADLNEGNVLNNYAFVFSTGAVLDSAQLSGKIINAVTLAPAEGILVMLHPAGADSAVYKRKPEYVARTNKEGAWSLSNIRPDSFEVVALKDENLNFLYDQETEWFGWFDHTIYTYSPKGILPEIRIFPKEKREVIKDVLQVSPGWMKVIIESPVPKPIPQFSPLPEQMLTSWDGDTLQIWYNPEHPYAGAIILGTDTTRIKAMSTSGKINEPLTIQNLSGRIHPLASALMATKVPIVKLDTSRILLERDSMMAIPFSIIRDSMDLRKFAVKAPWKPNTRHPMTFLPGALEDAWGRTNDTIRQSIVGLGADQFGELTVLIDGLDSTKSYVILVKSGEKEVMRFVADHQAEGRFKQGQVNPGKYTIEVIEDLNRNGAWDTGDYHLQRQPERKRFFTPDPMRAAWELEAKISWN